ncbi:MAG: cyclic pyranopterin monophosphate synthase MoaC [Candidatus Hydrogenedentes bacterium]|nr:cyclic pyranopterin monophosphate synthase MoaC [Candidatus Hydrogenedentota bacterium]
MTRKAQPFTHVDEKGRPAMVDVSEKQATRRIAHARSVVVLPSEVRAAIEGSEIASKKGPVFQTAIIAGVMAAKKTSELIPLCHPIGLEDCRVEIVLDYEGNAIIDCFTTVHHKTGVEMEALTGASVAALTIYDMCKGLSHDIVIRETRLIEKKGGKRDFTLQGR